MVLCVVAPGKLIYHEHKPLKSLGICLCCTKPNFCPLYHPFLRKHKCSSTGIATLHVLQRVAHAPTASVYVLFLNQQKPRSFSFSIWPSSLSPWMIFAAFALPSSLLQHPFYTKVIRIENDILNETLLVLSYNGRIILFDSNSIYSIHTSQNCWYIFVLLYHCGFKYQLLLHWNPDCWRFRGYDPFAACLALHHCPKAHTNDVHLICSSFDITDSL